MSGADERTAARDLLRGADRAGLATMLGERPDQPYASFVTVATAQDGTPILLLSELAVHTRNLRANPAAALLVEHTAGLDDPLTGARLTVLGRMGESADPADRARFLGRHPDAAGYADFADFRFWRLEVERAHLVAGFGRIRWIERDALVADVAAAALIAAEAHIVAHMNDDHGEAIALYATRLLGQAPGAWRMTGIDPFGLDLRAGGRVARLPFAEPVTTPEAARKTLADLARRARSS